MPLPIWGLRKCRSCNRPITAGQNVERLCFDDDPIHGVHEANGIYHTACAKPILALMRAMETARSVVR
jgi:hypothetical protein